MAAWFWCFLIYSFFGFLLEVVFARITRSPKRDRKCLYLLPLCPVYGLGGLLILWSSALLGGGTAAVAVCSFLAATAAEYLMGLFYERALGVRFWDYSHLPLNLGGKVCPPFSLAWCGLGLALVRWVHPPVWKAAAAIPGWIVLPAALLLALDCGHSMRLLRRAGDPAVLAWYRRPGKVRQT